MSQCSCGCASGITTSTSSAAGRFRLRSGGAAGEDAADAGRLVVAVPVEDGVQVGQVGLGGVGREFALEGLAGNARLLGVLNLGAERAPQRSARAVDRRHLLSLQT